MLKAILMASRMAAVVGVLAALPRMAAMQRDVLQVVNSTAGHGEGGDLSEQIARTQGVVNSQALNSQDPSSATSLVGLMGLLTGKPAEPSEPQKTTPKGPTTVIYHTDGKQGKGGTAVMQLPPDANVTFIDGRLQVYYPSGKKADR